MPYEVSSWLSPDTLTGPEVGYRKGIGRIYHLSTKIEKYQSHVSKVQ
jgi:hypothetical protein